MGTVDHTSANNLKPSQGKPADRPSDRPSAGRIVAVQAVAYLALAALSLLPVVAGLPLQYAFDPGTLSPVIGAALLVVVFHWYWPFEGMPGLGWFSRLFSLALGLCSVGFGWRVLTVADRYVTYRSASVRWACLFGILMTVLVIVGFGRQMLRRDRSHLIVTLSRCIVSGVCSAAAGGWCFLPVLFLEGEAVRHGLAWEYGFACAVVLVLVLAVGGIGVLWRGDDDLVAPRRWIGLGLMPVMVAGMPVFLGTLAMMFPLNW
ncbi:hypothetical protein [Bifidobacterium avesanii]|uniref:Beta-carotene 15,15'-monooxygenase n=1 Tax=Bifidobacterium avesanii TaxID=1798157 RepID=A0A7K3TG98_9BIFI|nr:hypothetical protein [Bifidobacterium avesanii]KAB8287042.1 hypothetical protein DSM100685_1973 [Bifidobacterium avesanii]NEG77694.1 hypothetical protein [Bifidobacterium avesanii]